MLENGSDRCTCKRKSCVRFGNCEECIKHHAIHKRYPLPYCKRKGKETNKNSVDSGEENNS